MRSETGLKEIIGSVIAGFAISILIGCAVVAHSIVESEQRARENHSIMTPNTPVLAREQLLNSAPSLSQSSIDTAIAMFGIRVPEGIVRPVLDINLTDRGLTMRRGALSQIKVIIGPDAFSSWSLLGSTIAHEVEVHCRQNFLAIHLMDMAGLDGTGMAEREAYSYELKHADRFGLLPYDRDLIRSTSSYYYPQRGFSISEIPSIKLLMSKLTRIDTRSQVKPSLTHSL